MASASMRGGASWGMATAAIFLTTDVLKHFGIAVTGDDVSAATILLGGTAHLVVEWLAMRGVKLPPDLMSDAVPAVPPPPPAPVPAPVK